MMEKFISHEETNSLPGIGSAAIQLAKLRGATVIAQCANEKKDEPRYGFEIKIQGEST